MCLHCELAKVNKENGVETPWPRNFDNESVDIYSKGNMLWVMTLAALTDEENPAPQDLVTIWQNFPYDKLMRDTFWQTALDVFALRETIDDIRNLPERA